MGRILRLRRKLHEPLYSERALATDPIAYWMLDEKQGNAAYDISRNEFHGAYTGVTLGQPGIGDGRTCPFFDGALDYNNIYSIPFRDAFDGSEGTLAVWARVDGVGVWTDVAFRAVIWLEADANNAILMRKGVVNNRLEWYYFAGGVIECVILAGLTTTDWMHLVLTWSASAGEVRAYYNGTQTGATQVGLGAWVGNLANTTTVIGAQSTIPAAMWLGRLAHGMVFDRALSPTEIADLAMV